MELTELKEDIENLQSGLDLGRSWYLTPRNPVSKRGTPRLRGLMSSLRSRFQVALPVAKPSELIALGFSYDGVYGRTSRSVHFSVGKLGERANASSAKRNLLHVGFLAMLVIIRVAELIGVEAKTPDMESDLNSLLEMSDAQKLVERLCTKIAEPGDFVVAFDHLAEIEGEKVGPYGYRVYHVRYLDENQSSRPTTTDEWVPGDHIKVLFKRSSIESQVLQLINEGHLPQELASKLLSTTDEDLRRFRHQAVLDTWNAGLRDYIFGKRQ